MVSQPERRSTVVVAVSLETWTDFRTQLQIPIRFLVQCGEMARRRREQLGSPGGRKGAGSTMRSASWLAISSESECRPPAIACFYTLLIRMPLGLGSTRGDFAIRWNHRLWVISYQLGGVDQTFSPSSRDWNSPSHRTPCHGCSGSGRLDWPRRAFAWVPAHGIADPRFRVPDDGIWLDGARFLYHLSWKVTTYCLQILQL